MGEADRSFRFLFRTDQGAIDRSTWWRGTVPIAAVGAVATAGWLAVRPFTHDALHQPPALAVLGYLYLLAFTFAVLILLICEYNLSAKRFAARGKPRALAALLPLGLLASGAFAWYAPRSQGAVPGWSVEAAVACVLAIAVWFIVELGLRRDAP
jgi:uncharacterized membrane protein YhaH (DUF805 family)